MNSVYIYLYKRRRRQRHYYFLKKRHARCEFFEEIRLDSASEQEGVKYDSGENGEFSEQRIRCW